MPSANTRHAQSSQPTTSCITKGSKTRLQTKQQSSPASAREIEKEGQGGFDTEGKKIKAALKQLCRGQAPSSLHSTDSTGYKKLQDELEENRRKRIASPVRCEEPRANTARMEEDRTPGVTVNVIVKGHRRCPHDQLQAVQTLFKDICKVPSMLEWPSDLA